METENKTSITVENTVNVPIADVWKFWTEPEHIKNWNNASDDWHTPFAENDVRIGGKFMSRMEAKDGSVGFDFSGTYDDVETNKIISYTLDDGRKVKALFSNQDGKTKVVETFEAENTHPIEMQRGGWQAILDNFKKYVESVE